MNEDLAATKSHVEEFGASSRRLGAMAMQNTESHTHLQVFCDRAQRLGAMGMQNNALEVLLNKIKDVETSDEQRTALHEVFGSISELTI